MSNKSELQGEKDNNKIQKRNKLKTRNKTNTRRCERKEKVAERIKTIDRKKNKINIIHGNVATGKKNDKHSDEKRKREKNT